MHWIDLTDLTKLSYAALYSAMLFSGSMAKISVVLFGYQGIHFVFIIPHWRYVILLLILLGAAFHGISC